MQILTYIHESMLRINKLHSTLTEFVRSVSNQLEVAGIAPSNHSITKFNLIKIK